MTDAKNPTADASPCGVLLSQLDARLAECASGKHEYYCVFNESGWPVPSWCNAMEGEAVKRATDWGTRKWSEMEAEGYTIRRIVLMPAEKYHAALRAARLLAAALEFGSVGIDGATKSTADTLQAIAANPSGPWGQPWLENFADQIDAALAAAVREIGGAT